MLVTSQGHVDAFGELTIFCNFPAFYFKQYLYKIANWGTIAFTTVFGEVKKEQ